MLERVVEEHLFTVEEFAKMLRADVLDADKKFELIEGKLFEMTAMESPHFATVMRLNYLFVERLGKRAQTSVQSPIRLSERSAPEPDLALLRPRQDFYATQIPTANDALLLVEVAFSSYQRDKTIKLPLYAKHGVAETWLVDLNAKRIEAHREPKDGVYRQTLIFDETQNIAPMNFPDIAFSVAEILGAKPMSL
ncbi:MAG: Uma2 family endonuclease [Chloroherpetonaceae bacterium]|nr:Uma2 family endonuclease [Chloroherpetonaceae bacterium]